MHGLAVYRELTAFVAHYLIHILEEETLVMPAIWRSCTDTEITAARLNLQADQSTVGITRSRRAILPAITDAERDGTGRPTWIDQRGVRCVHGRCASGARACGLGPISTIPLRSAHSAHTINKGVHVMSTIHITESTIEPRSNLLYRWGCFAASNPWRVVGSWVLVAVAALLLNSSIGGEVTNTVRVPGTEAQSAADLLSARFPSRGDSSGLVVFADDNGGLTDPRDRAAIVATLAALQTDPAVASVSDPFDPEERTISTDGLTG